VAGHKPLALEFFGVGLIRLGSEDFDGLGDIAGQFVRLLSSASGKYYVSK